MRGIVQEGAPGDGGGYCYGDVEGSAGLARELVRLGLIEIERNEHDERRQPERRSYLDFRKIANNDGVSLVATPDWFRKLDGRGRGS